MPYKDPVVRKAKNKEYSRKDYLGNYAKRREKLNARRRELKKEWDTFKSGLKCTECGFDNPAALDFHHENPKEKTGSVNKFVSNGQFARAYEEIKKCIVLCANCHRVHHAKQKKKPPEGGSKHEV